VPYDGHVRPDVFMCSDGSLGAVLHVPGFSFELEDMGVRNVRRRQINALARNVADDNVTVAAHLVRHRLVPDFPAGTFTGPFAQHLDQRIRDRQAGQAFVNDWFLTIMVSPRAGVQRTLVSAWERVKPQRFRKPLQPSESRLRALEDRVLALMAYFRRAGVRRLGVRTDQATGQEFSEIAEVFRLARISHSGNVGLLKGTALASVHDAGRDGPI
jgi:type IV secretion system protein VirB4